MFATGQKDLNSCQTKRASSISRIYFQALVQRRCKMRTPLSKCPICQGELVITKFHCQNCDTTVEGRFTNGPFPSLTPEQLDFVETFIRCEGKINRMEAELDLSYPTIRNRLHEVIRTMGFEPGKDEMPEVDDDKRRGVLEDLDAGKISAEDAMRLLRGEEE